MLKIETEHTVRILWKYALNPWNIKWERITWPIRWFSNNNKWLLFCAVYETDSVSLETRWGLWQIQKRQKINTDWWRKRWGLWLFQVIETEHTVRILWKYALNPWNIKWERITWPIRWFWNNNNWLLFCAVCGTDSVSLQTWWGLWQIQKVDSSGRIRERGEDYDSSKCNTWSL